MCHLHRSAEGAATCEPHLARAPPLPARVAAAALSYAHRRAPWRRAAPCSRWRCAAALRRRKAPIVSRRTTCASARRLRCAATTWPPWATCVRLALPGFCARSTPFSRVPARAAAAALHCTLSRARRSVRRSPLRRQHPSRNHVHECDGACPHSRALALSGLHHLDCRGKRACPLSAPQACYPLPNVTRARPGFATMLLIDRGGCAPPARCLRGA